MRTLRKAISSKIACIFAAAILAALVSGQPIRSHAQTQGGPTPEALQAATELAAVITSDTMQQMSAQAVGAMWPKFERDLRAKQPSITNETVGGLRREFEQIATNHMADMMKDAPRIYARYFTAEELRDFLAFYRTPSGAKSLKVMPQIGAEVMQSAMSRMKNLEADLTAAFARVLRQRGI